MAVAGKLGFLEVLIRRRKGGGYCEEHAHSLDLGYIGEREMYRGRRGRMEE